ncbi:MAG: hypothetical protein ACYSTR_02800 [Planctomycetota bacterium]
MASSTVIEKQELTNDDLAKVNVGVCPRCGEELKVRTEMHHHERSRLYYDQGDKKWYERFTNRAIFKKRITQIECIECSSEFDPDLLRDEIQLNVIKKMEK